MTIIVGKKHEQGVMIAYDTAELIHDPKYNYKIKKYVHKVNPISQDRAIGMSGTIRQDYITSAKDVAYEGNFANGIDKFLNTHYIDEHFLRAVFYCEFMFADPNGFIKTNNGEYRLKDEQYTDYVSMGHGSYPDVSQFLDEHKSISSQKLCREQLEHAIILSKTQNKQDPLFEKGYMLKGLGIVNITKGKYEILAFSKD